jgi:hypothetical protein
LSRAIERTTQKARPISEIRKRLRHPAIVGAPALPAPFRIKGRVIDSKSRRPLVRVIVTLEDVRELAS